jgi:tyrosine-protein phosphatase YwqE
MAFGKLFGQKKLSKPVDLKPVAADMHSHLIPGIDDGARTIEDSLVLIRRMKGMGYRKLITTPHIQNDFYKNTPETIKDGLVKVKEAVNEEGLGIEVEAAAEYLIDDGFESKMESGDLMTFGDHYILIELSYYNPYPNIKEIIFNLQIEGYKVILAHPERYSYWFNDWQKFTDLKDRSVFFQLNAVSLSGHYPDPVQKIARKMVDEGLIDFIGSDAHNPHYLDSLDKARHEKTLDKLIKSGKLRNSQL